MAGGVLLVVTVNIMDPGSCGYVLDMPGMDNFNVNCYVTHTLRRGNKETLFVCVELN